MSKKDLIIGLDIGTTKVCCVVARAHDSGRVAETHLDILGIGLAPSHGLKKGIVVNIDATVESIRRAVEDAQRISGEVIDHVYTGIAGAHIKSFNSSGIVAIRDGEVRRSDVNRVIEAASAVSIPSDRELIHIIPQEFMIDAQRGIRDPIGMSGTRLETQIHLVTGSQSSTQNVIKCASRARLRVAGICLEPIASAEAILTDDEKDLGVAVVDIGGGTCDIAIYKNGVLAWTSIIAIGGQHITNDIAIGLRASQQESEQLKMEHGCALQELVSDLDSIQVQGVTGRHARRLKRKELVEIIEPRAAEILNLIKKELQKSGYDHQLAAGVVLTGGTSLLEGLVDLGEIILSLPVKLGIPKNLGGLKESVSHPKYATAIGLARFGLQHSMLDELSAFGVWREIKGVSRNKLSGGSVKNWLKDLF
jgi:cell division protein FtsA